MHASNERRYMRAQYGFRKLDLSSPIHLSFDDFEQIVAESKATWLNRDGRIEVDGFEALIREQMRQYVQRHTAQAMQGAVLSGSAIGHVLFVLKAMGTTLEDVNSRIDQMVQRDDGTCSYPGAEDSLRKASAWSQKFPANDRKFAEISSDGRRDEALHERLASCYPAGLARIQCAAEAARRAASATCRWPGATRLLVQDWTTGAQVGERLLTRGVLNGVASARALAKLWHGHAYIRVYPWLQAMH